MDFKNITLETKAGIARLTINRPPVNVMNYDTIVEISAALEDVAKNNEAKVLIIRGAGTRAFCAGVEVKDHIGDMVPKMMTGFEIMIRLLRRLSKPSIAAVNGVALGGGCEVVAACDMAIASDKAQFGQPEVKLGGLAPAAAALFPKIMPEKKAFELILLGDNITAQDAELDAATEVLAKKFMEKSSLALKLVKEALYQAADAADFSTAMKRATELGIKSWQTEDAQEGLKSFLEKRLPVWKNK